MNRSVSVAVANAILASSYTLPSHAQTSGASDAIEEIIVTARKREESLQDVPISISVTTGEYIQESGVKGLEELSQSLPAVNISKGGASDQLYVRGIGSGFNAGFEQAVGTYLDGVYLGRSRNTRASFLDRRQRFSATAPSAVL